jgi:hypothetical protein
MRQVTRRHKIMYGTAGITAAALAVIASVLGPLRPANMSMGLKPPAAKAVTAAVAAAEAPALPAQDAGYLTKDLRRRGTPESQFYDPAPPAVYYPGVPYAPRGSFLAKEEAQGGDCTLTVPADPLSAQGLATPYILGNGPNTTCSMDTADVAATGAFVQATILEPGGGVFVYDPLVISAGTTPAEPPVVPDIPAGSIVTIDTGFNGNIDFLTGPGAYLFDQGIFADGAFSPFGQVAFANGPAFFAAAYREVIVPPLGMAKDGTPCPTTRAFNLVDQDPSDNVTTQYLVTPGGQTAQDNAANLAALPGATVENNGSDNFVLNLFLDPALGCTPFEAPSLSDPGNMSSSQALDEIQANADQAAPAGLVPVNDPMTTVGADDDIIADQAPTAGNLSILKTDAYRLGIGQPLLFYGAVNDAEGFCNGMIGAGAQVTNEANTYEMGVTFPITGTVFGTFMINRYQASLQLLNCALFTPAALAADPYATPSATATPTATATATATPSDTPSPTPTPAPTYSYYTPDPSPVYSYYTGGAP